MCSAQTSGVFNPAKKLIEKLALQDERDGSDIDDDEDQRKKEAEPEGSSDDESD